MRYSQHSAVPLPPSRTLLTVIMAAAAASVLSACDGIVEPAASKVAAAPVLARQMPAAPFATPPVMRTSTPRYPAAVVYILYREYLHKHPGTTSLTPDDPDYQRYMERRLRQLYPARGYSGMVRDAVQEAKLNRRDWERYERELQIRGGMTIQVECEVQPLYVEEDNTCTGGGGGGGDAGGGYVDPYADPLVDPSWDGQDEFHVPADSELPTIQMEIDTLQLEQPEVDQIYYYESLATGTYRENDIQVQSVGTAARIDDLIRAAGEESTQNGEVSTQIAPAIVSAALVGLGVIGWKAYRALQASDRARQRSEQYYPHLAYNDTKRDAHRHIFWSMMLRRYIGATLAKEITDYHERDSSGAGKVMDLHNNDIGRSYRYRRFRDHWFWDRWDWNNWGLRIRDYIDNEAENGAYIPEWFGATLSTEAAWAREASVSNVRYIYFAQ